MSVTLSEIVVAINSDIDGLASFLYEVPGDVKDEIMMALEHLRNARIFLKAEIEGDE